VRVHVRLAPKAARDRIGGIHADTDGCPLLKVAVTAPPEGGKANAALIKLLAKEWRLPKSAFAIAAGAAERRKVLTIAGDTNGLMDRLAAWSARHERNKGERDK
jgi:uncharacterized protein (TIGR00251 family)